MIVDCRKEPEKFVTIINLCYPLIYYSAGKFIAHPAQEGQSSGSGLL